MNRARLVARAAKIRTQISGPADTFLALRILMWVIAMHGLKHVLPLSMLVRMMRRRQVCAARAIERERQVVTLARWSCRLIARSDRGNCLERGLVAYRYLCALGAKPQLIIGVARKADGMTRGHVWVVVDDRAVDDESESLDGFERAVAFGHEGDLVPTDQYRSSLLTRPIP